MGLFLFIYSNLLFALAIFYLFYRLLLARETFHRFNRFSLLGILLLSCLLPLVEVSVKQETEVHQTMLTLEQLLMMADAVNATEADKGLKRQQSPGYKWRCLSIWQESFSLPSATYIRWYGY